MPSYLNVMIEGCCHGALDDIYAALREVERRRGVKVDLLICCGDFQGLRSEADFEALAVPAKYREMNSFVKYYRGEAEAPCLTVFVGGNHEASNQLGSLFCFILAAVLLVFFVVRLDRNRRESDMALEALRQQATEEDHIIRMGLLASGAAHELLQVEKKGKPDGES